jgi:hypothetical protein
MGGLPVLLSRRPSLRRPRAGAARPADGRLAQEERQGTVVDKGSPPSREGSRREYRAGRTMDDGCLRPVEAASCRSGWIVAREEPILPVLLQHKSPYEDAPVRLFCEGHHRAIALLRLSGPHLSAFLLGSANWFD